MPALQMKPRHEQKTRLEELASFLMRTPALYQDGFFSTFITALTRLAAIEVCLWPMQLMDSSTYDGLFASILGIIHPSDGHPQEEHAPDFGWFRPLAHNNATWVLYWPELEV